MDLLEKSSSEFALKRQIPARKVNRAGDSSGSWAERARRVYAGMDSSCGLRGCDRARPEGGEVCVLAYELHEDLRDARVEMRPGISL